MNTTRNRDLVWGMMGIFSLITSGCDLLFVPEIFPPRMELLHPSDTLWLQAGTDSLRLEFRIEDEDGDLGRDNGDQTKDLWLLEVRNGEPLFDSLYTELVVPNLTPKGAAKRIDATLKLVLDPLVLREGLALDSAQIYAVIRDRAGNFCPVVSLPVIYLRGS
jgi:hypothetical protein